MEELTDPTEISVTARKILETFVTPGAPRVVNLSGDTISSCLVHLSCPFPNMFKNAKKEIFNLMFVNYGFEFIEKEGLLEKLTNEKKPRVISQSPEEDLLRHSWATPQDNFQEDIPTSIPHSDSPIEASTNWRKIITPRWLKATSGPNVPILGNSSPQNEMVVSNTEFIKPNLSMTKTTKSIDSIFDQLSRETVSPLTTRDRNETVVDTENNETLFTRGRSSSTKKSLRSSERKSPKPNTRAIRARTSKKKPKSVPTTPDVLRKCDMNINNNNTGKTEPEKENLNNTPKKLTNNNNNTGKTEPEKENLNNTPKKLTSNSCGRVNSESFRPSRKKNSLDNLSQSEINSNHYNRRRAFSSCRPLKNSSYSISMENQNKQK